VLGEKRRELTEILDVFAELFVEVRSLHLHHHAPAVPQLCGVHLPETRASQWLLVE
jgi:hypothetical protein